MKRHSIKMLLPHDMTQSFSAQGFGKSSLLFQIFGNNPLYILLCIIIWVLVDCCNDNWTFFSLLGFFGKLFP